MKKHRDKSIVQITSPKIEEYARAMTTFESEDVKALVASSDEALEYIDMLSGNLVAQMLRMLIQVSKARRILEIGTFTGYSAIVMAEVIPDDGEIITMEMNLRYQELALKHFRQFDHQNKITLLEGNARELIPELRGDFDLIFIDADKLSYEDYFIQTLPLLKQGGLMVVDNVLWDGMVLDPEDHKAQALHEFNKMVSQDDRVEQVMLPVRDGLTIIRKK
jgi:caffeoyl-CoA O-methyltransferase